MVDTNTQFSQLEKRIERLEKAVFNTKSKPTIEKTNYLEPILVKHVNSIKTQHLVVLSLKLNKTQTKNDIKKTLQDWGKVFGSWFDGGNFNNRLLKTNIVKIIEKNKKDNYIFSLTQKGNLEADKFIGKIQKLEESQLE